MSTAQKAETMLAEAHRRQTQVFVSEAIKEWDEGGEGYFYQWVVRVVLVKWARMAKKN